MTPLRPFSTPPTTPKFWFAATASRSDAVSATATLDARVASSSPSFPLLVAASAKSRWRSMGSRLTDTVSMSLKLPTSARVSALPLSVPGRSVAFTQAFGYLMKNPALPTKGASSAVGASSTGSASAIGAAITLGRSVHAASPRAVPFSASRLPIGASRVPRRGGANVVSPRRCDGLLGPDAPRRHDRRDPVYRSSEGEAHGSVDRAPAPMGCDDKKSTSSAAPVDEA